VTEPTRTYLLRGCWLWNKSGKKQATDFTDC
jgi:hypothetical protein